MKHIYFFGECMVELRAIKDTVMHQSFAGDVYNSAVYLKRCFPLIATSIVTAIGQDRLSDKMLCSFKSEGINTALVFRHESKVPGIYLVDTDKNGERSFTYWRQDSAARKVVAFLNDACVQSLTSADMFFFSGISLAVLKENSRQAFWQTLKQVKDGGVKIVFDPNYRARLWSSADEAKRQFEKALSLADIALPGVEDLMTLYDINSAQEAVDFCLPFGLSEVVVKNGSQSVITFAEGKLLRHDIRPVNNVIDTTSAGDAFNGVYLGARLSGRTITDAVRLASAAAGSVIQHPGAISPKAAFTRAMSEVGI